MSSLGAMDIERLKALIRINIPFDTCSYSNINELYVSILKCITHILNCSYSAFFTFNSSFNYYTPLFLINSDGEKLSLLSYKKEEYIEFVAKNIEIIVFNEKIKSNNFNIEINNSIIFPIYFENECIGVLQAINKKDNVSFNKSDSAFLQILGEYAGIVCKNYALYLQAGERITELQTVISKKTSSIFIAESPVLKDIKKMVEGLYSVSSPILIVGESGTGKEVLAEYIHSKSSRASYPLVKIKCALNNSSLEEELFGKYPNAIEKAWKGTLFIDSITDMPLHIQGKLQTILQQKKFYRNGTAELIPVDIRLITSSNTDIEDLVKKHLFREDLYYRINVLPINLPPLRRRKEDIKALSMYFLEKYSVENQKKFSGFSSSAMKKLQLYSWPNNIRELSNVIECACIREVPPIIKNIDIRNVKDSNIYIDESIESPQLNIMPNKVDRSLKNAVNVFKKQYLEQILKETDWNQTETAKILKVQRTYVSKLIMELGIKRPLKDGY